MTTTARALAAAKEAERAGFVVREIVVEGKRFQLVLGDKQQTKDEYVMRPIRAS